jgi:hypothetical protein
VVRLFAAAPGGQAREALQHQHEERILSGESDQIWVIVNLFLAGAGGRIIVEGAATGRRLLKEGHYLVTGERLDGLGQKFVLGNALRAREGAQRHQDLEPARITCRDLHA